MPMPKGLAAAIASLAFFALFALPAAAAEKAGSDATDAKPGKSVSEKKQEHPDLSPSGRIDFVYGQAAFLLSGSGGKGTLSFKGKKYQIELGGLGIGGIGVSKVTASGEVYNLKTLADFPGTYIQGRMGYALGEGKGSLWLENTKGVVLKLKTRNKGVALSLGGDGLIVGFKQKKKAK